MVLLSLAKVAFKMGKKVQIGVKERHGRTIIWGKHNTLHVYMVRFTGPLDIPPFFGGIRYMVGGGMVVAR